MDPYCLAVQFRRFAIGDKKRHQHRARITPQHLDGSAPRRPLAVVDLAQVQHLALNAVAAVLDHAPVAVLLAILEASLGAHEHGAVACPITRQIKGQGRHYSRLHAAPSMKSVCYITPAGPNSTKLVAKRIELRKASSFIKDACGNHALHEGFVAVLECPWAYWKLGKLLAQKGLPDPWDQKWIEGYASKEMAQATLEFLAIWERMAADLGPIALNSAYGFARTAVRYDWMFWDALYRDEHWPV